MYVFIYIVSNLWLGIETKEVEFGWILPASHRSYSTYFSKQNPYVGSVLCDFSLYYLGTRPKEERNNCISTWVELSGCLESGEITIDLRLYTWLISPGSGLWFFDIFGNDWEIYCIWSCGHLLLIFFLN